MLSDNVAMSIVTIDTFTIGPLLYLNAVDVTTTFLELIARYTCFESDITSYLQGTSDASGVD